MIAGHKYSPQVIISTFVQFLQHSFELSVTKQESPRKKPLPGRRKPAPTYSVCDAQIPDVRALRDGCLRRHVMALRGREERLCGGYFSEAGEGVSSGGADQRISLNGLTMVIRFATSKPVRMSSEYRTVHPACKAQATTRLSQ